jgi:uncharacterized membrane protein YphA (DoxX/SURF4 family)
MNGTAESALTAEQHVTSSVWRTMRVAFGLMPLLAGLDKFFNLLTDWPKYLSPWVAHLLPVSAQTFMYAVGVIEIVVGLLVLTRWTRLGAWIAAAWLVLIALNLITLGLFDIAVRDLAMSVGAYTLARLAELRQESPAAVPASTLRTSRA